ncbi:MAG: FecR domain-containing protein [Bacteroidales bacterium]|nr:FecR domain-containing protein [Bacteroidales bacterium]
MESKEMKEKYEDALKKAKELSENILKDPQDGDIAYYNERKKNLSQINTNRAWSRLWFGRRGVELISVASAAVIVLLLSLVIFIPAKQKDSEKTVKLSNLLPVKGMVTLELSSGEIVELDSNSNLAERLSGIIVDANENEISYAGVDRDETAANEIYKERKESDKGKRETTVEYNELSIPKGRSYSVVLSDGSRVWLNAQSKIKYPVRFSKNERRVYISGEAYFEVVKDDKIPFLVETSDYSVKVLGTKFNVNAYPDERVGATTLVTGSISIPSSEGGDRLILPGEQFKFNKESKSISIEMVNTDLYTSWIDNVLIMDQMPLEEIFKILNRRYEINIFFDDESIKKETFSGAIPLNDYLNIILNQISKVSNVDFQMEGSVVIVRYK